jgi:flagellin-like hook-associated protein FlgL
MFKIFSEVRELKLEVANLKKKLIAADGKLKDVKPMEKISIDLAKEKAEADKLKKKKEEMEKLEKLEKEKLEKEKLEKTPIVNPETNIYAVNTRVNEIHSRLDKVVSYIKVNMKKELDEKLAEINNNNKTEIFDILQRIEVTLTNKVVSLFEEMKQESVETSELKPTNQLEINALVNKIEQLGNQHISLYTKHNVKITDIVEDLNTLITSVNTLEVSTGASEEKLNLVLTKLSSFEANQKELSSLLERFVGYFENLYKSKTSV